MILLLACTDPDKRADSTAPDTAAETAFDSVADSVADTLDSTGHTDTDATDTSDTTPAHTADTASDTDTGAHVPPSDWEPGDDVPGWPDHDCTEEPSGRVHVTEFPTVNTFLGTFPAGAADGEPGAWSLELRDCVAYACDELSPRESQPYAEVAASSSGAKSTPGGFGWWGTAELPTRLLTAQGNGPLERWSTDLAADASWATVSVCLSRFRPDRIEGAVRVEITAGNSTVDQLSYYEAVLYRFPFAVEVEPGAGLDLGLPDKPHLRPATYDAAHFEYEADFDDAWDWDAVEDPGVRARIRELYRPYNQP